MSSFMPNAEPFFLSGNSIGCLLIHGFTGTPYEMRALGNFLAGHGYTISAPALAGHATALDDMLTTRWTDWHASVVAAYAELRTHCEKIFPIGLSLGGTLVLHLAAHRPVDGVVAVSAPFRISNSLIPLFKTLPLLHRFIPTIRKNPNDIDTVDMTIHPAHPEYPAIPTRAAASFLLDFLPHLHNDLRDITAPVLLIQSRGDRTIPANSLDEYARHIRAPKEIVWLERGGHLALEDVSKEIAFEHILKFIQNNMPQRTQRT